jgi:hypothetical protein
MVRRFYALYLQFYGEHVYAVGLVKSNYMKTTETNSDVWQEGDYFVAQCLDVNVSSFGLTKEEALANLQEAIELNLDEE